MRQTNKPSRRKFIDYLMATSLGAVVVSVFYPVVSFLVPPQTAESAEMSVVAARLDEVPLNSGKTFKFGSRPGLLVRTPSGDLKAFAATCTHLDCTVQYRPELSRIWCACHDGHFDLNGRNIAGPPPRPLDEYKVNVRGDEIVVSRG
jgi:cytochrome b6-f complex iron-sulfur subunit